MLNEILPGLALTLIVEIIIVGLIYYPSSPSRREYIFTFFVFNLLIYFVSGLLRDVQLTLGFGFGLLAVFSTLRYRTEQVPVREMTYLFISITIPFMNTLFMATRMTFPELITVNAIIVAAVLVLEQKWLIPTLENRLIRYEKIELVTPRNHAAMLSDLRTRTGLDIKRFDIQEIDFLRDTALIIIYYTAPDYGDLMDEQPEP
ncbi:MAG: DUF4956 domain-containing protein [Caldilineaceae bacterium]|nr:DUF4956 domain-containing protein [Caldilineaceae bacterium]MCB9155635.1 DUF4956 domain-containing protein [Caldilineaceae bacterium]